MPKFEISITESGLDYGTTSGALDISEAEARSLFEKDLANLVEGQTIELWNLDTDESLVKHCA